MNKHIVADMITEKLKMEIGMVAKPLSEELRILEAEIPPEIGPPGGKMRMEASLYQADKIKKITIIRNRMGEFSNGSIVLIIPENEYELPFIVIDVTFLSFGTGKFFTELDAKPLVKDKESMSKFIDPFQKWREEIGKLPSEPITGRPEPGKFIKDSLSPINYLRFIPEEYKDEVLKLTDQFLDIYISIYRKAGLMKDVQRKKKMDAFRSEFNRCFLEDDPAGVMLINVFGREKAQRYCENLVSL